jgi:hypothetical protein
LKYEILKVEYAKSLAKVEEKWQCFVDANGDCFVDAKTAFVVDEE